MGTSRVLGAFLPLPAAVLAAVNMGIAEGTGNQPCLVGVTLNIQADDIDRINALTAGNNALNIHILSIVLPCHVDIATVIIGDVRVLTDVVISNADKQGLGVLPVIGEGNSGGSPALKVAGRLAVPQQLGKLVPAADSTCGVDHPGVRVIVRR